MNEMSSSGPKTRYRIGFDIGGTFTDFALHDRVTGQVHVWKRLSTPSDPSVGALAGLDDLLSAHGLSADQVEQVVHGTTIGANTVIERKGARTALITTDGFRDILIMQRPRRYSTYDLWFDKHEPLVPRRHIYEAVERVSFDGTVLKVLDEPAIRDIADSLAEEGIESAAVCFLHSYANGDHERRAAALVRESLPNLSVSISDEVAPMIGEYERASTTVVNAYIRPEFEQYLQRLESAMRRRGFAGRIFINQGNGGLTTPAEVEEFPVRALESGPAAGVSMAAVLGQTIGRSEIIAFDMGGTTAKACLIEGGVPRMERVFDVDQTLMRQGTGLPVAVPTVDLIEIGAGGGSIADVHLGIIEVGPESAGADPGPVCYARGGRRPTVTDANVVLGYLNPDFFLGGEMELDVDGARTAIAQQIGHPLGLGEAEAAWGVHEAVSSNMEHAIRSVSIERGRDPRDLTLVAFGGAGPSHAARLARNLGVREVVFPAAAGIASAVGLLQAAPRTDITRTVVIPLDDSGFERLRAELAEIEQGVVAMLERISTDHAGRTLRRSVDMRYVGQGHVVEVELPDLATTDFLRSLRDRFASKYAELFGYSYDTATPQIVAVTVTGSVPAPAFELPLNDAHGELPSGRARPVYFPETDGFVDCETYRRDELPAGCEIVGPAVIEDGQCAALLLPGDHATVDAHRNVIARIASGVAGANDVLLASGMREHVR
jgi:N-methylhydantoinase A